VLSGADADGPHDEPGQTGYRKDPIGFANPPRLEMPTWPTSANAGLTGLAITTKGQWTSQRRGPEYGQRGSG
ncbi:hypothetical protein U8M34_29255, partial [Klebsiella pneumoniae]|uniref:hypothetical protein n=1 Tax=Klebsiella pneumoniae TaxID=573 RepID=UPI002AE0A368